MIIDLTKNTSYCHYCGLSCVPLSEFTVINGGKRVHIFCSNNDCLRRWLDDQHELVRLKMAELTFERDQRKLLLEAIAEQVDNIDHQHRNHGLNEIGWCEEEDFAFKELFRRLYELQAYNNSVKSPKIVSTALD